MGFDVLSQRELARQHWMICMGARATLPSAAGQKYETGSEETKAEAREAVQHQDHFEYK